MISQKDGIRALCLQRVLRPDIRRDYPDCYFDEFTFYLSLHTSASRGKLLYRVVQQAVRIGPVPHTVITQPLPFGGGE